MNYLTDQQREAMQHVSQQTAVFYKHDTVQVHNHIYAGGSGASKAQNGILALVGAALIGVIAYSVYAGQPLSATMASLETAISGGELLQQAQTTAAELLQEVKHEP